MTEIALRTTQLTKRFGKTLAVDRLDLEVRRGEMFGLIGPNGAGKTTTINMVLGLLRPTSGSIELLGLKGHDGLARARLRLGALVERGGFLPYLAGRENLQVFARTFGIRDTQRLTDLLELVDLSPKADAKYKTYSQGMRRRLALAASLLRDPELLLLDEPLNGLDPQGMHEVRQLLRRLAAAGKTVLLSSHWLHDIEQLCQRVAIINEGRLVRQGELSGLLKDSRYIRLRVADLEHCATLLRQEDWIEGVEIGGDWLIVRAPAERSADVSAALARHGQYPMELWVAGITLEDFFISITEEQGDD